MQSSRTTEKLLDFPKSDGPNTLNR